MTTAHKLPKRLPATTHEVAPRADIVALMAYVRAAELWFYSNGVSERRRAQEELSRAREELGIREE